MQGVKNDQFKKKSAADYLEAKEIYALTRKQWLFGMKYVNEAECIGWKAASLSYGKADGIIDEGGSMAKDMAMSIAHQNLKKPNIRTFIQDLMGEVSMTSNEVLHRITRIAKGNFADLMDIDENGNAKLNLAKARTAGALFLIKKLNMDAFGNLKSVELHDAFSALTKLGQHHKIFDRNREATIDPKDLARELLDDLRAKHEGIPDSTLIEKVLARFSGQGITESDLIDSPEADQVRG